MSYIKLYRHDKNLMKSDLTNLDLKFIRRQANGAARSLAKEAPFNLSLHTNYNISSCISDILINEMQ